jgi:hypothetical protein
VGGQNIDELLEILEDNTTKATCIIKAMRYGERGNFVSKHILTSLVDEVVRLSDIGTAATILNNNCQINTALELAESHFEYVTAARIAKEAEEYARATTNYELASTHTDSWENRKAYLKNAIDCCVKSEDTERAIGILLSQQDHLNSKLPYKEAADIAKGAKQHVRKRALLMMGYRKSVVDKDEEVMKTYAGELKKPELLVDGYESLGNYSAAACMAIEVGQTERATALRKKDLLQDVSSGRCHMSGRRYSENKATHYGLQTEYVEAMIELVRSANHYKDDVEDTAKFAVIEGMVDKAFEICELGGEFHIALHIARAAKNSEAIQKYKKIIDTLYR